MLNGNSTAIGPVQRFDITPVPKPRMTKRDQWAKRACVTRYFDFKDQVRAAGLSIPETGCRIIFVMPMPKSWSRKKKAQMMGMPHKQTPDTDNMVKAVLDAVHQQDSQIYHVEGLKFWGEVGHILVERTAQAVRMEGNHIVWSDAA